jgi:uncharacterized protein (TIGR03435 family)
MNTVIKDRSQARWIVALVIGLGLARVALDMEWLRAQSRGDRPPQFEVSSIRLNKSGETRVSGGFQAGGRYKVGNYTLRALVAAAYLRPQVNPDFLIDGGPPWIDNERFDIEAKAASEFPAGPDGPNAPRRVMVQALLAERFKLAVHHESRNRSIYALTMARPDDRMGPKLRPSLLDCAEAAPAGGAAGAPACAVRVGPGSVHGSGITVTQLLNLLPRFVDRVVADRTGLSGRFDLDLDWTPAAGEWVAPPIAGAPGPASDGPSLFTALQEQLGLKLTSTTGPVDVLVIDRAELPAED